MAEQVEAEPLLQRQELQPNSKLSALIILIPTAIFTLNSAVVTALFPQWLVLYLCARFVEPGLKLEDYLPGFYNAPILNRMPRWEVCSKHPEMQSFAVTWAMVVLLSTRIPMLITGPFYGSLSDRIGRKPLVLLTMLAKSVYLAAILSAVHFNTGLWILLAAGILVGSLGGTTNMVSPMLAYFADTTTPKNRNSIFIVGESLLLCMNFVGPFLGGSLARVFPDGTFLVLEVCLAINTALLILTAMLLPESLNVKNENPLTFQDSIRLTIEMFKKAAHPTFVCLVVVFCLKAASVEGRLLLFNYESFVFGWDARDDGLLLLATGFAGIFQIAVIFPILKGKYKSFRSTKAGQATFDLIVIRFGMILNAVVYFSLALAPNGTLYFIILLSNSFSLMALPIVKSILSCSVDNKNQGLLFSGLAWLQLCISILSSVVYPFIWRNTVNTNPQAFLLVMSLINVMVSLATFYPTAQSVADCALERSVEEQVLNS